MSYNQSNLLDRIEKMQEVWSHYAADERSNEWIYTNHIKEPFNISIKTMYNWLNVNVPVKRRELEEGQNTIPPNQMTLFGDE